MTLNKPTNDKGTTQGFLTVVAMFFGLAVWIYSSKLTPEERDARCRQMLLNEEIAYKRYENLSMRFKQLYGRDIEISETLSPKTQLVHDIGQAESELLHAKSGAYGCKRGAQEP